VTVTGQGIDTDRFAPTTKAPGGPPTVLSVGRFSPIKDYETLLDAFARLPADGTATCPAPRLELLGGLHSRPEREYLNDLCRRAARLGLADRVSFSTGLPHSQIAPVYQRATLFASCSRTGSLDKAVLEAAACGVPPLVGNVAFRPFLGAAWDELSFPPGDAAALAERLAGWLARGDGERRELALRLRGVVEREHSLTHLADSLIAMIGRRAGRS
jgi:glycosyltransferase involved in cell wall biosynthesis